MLLNVVSLFCLEAVNLVSCSSSSSAGKQGITLGFSQTWKSFVFSQSSKIKRQYLSSFSFYMASIYSLYLSMELNYKTWLLFQRFPTNEWKALTGKHHMKREERDSYRKCSHLVKFSEIRNEETVYLQTATAERKGRIEHTPVSWTAH